MLVKGLEVPMPHALHHLAVGARDVSRIAAFYADMFALPEIARHLDDEGVLRSIWLDLGGSILMVERTTDPARTCELGAGPFLLAFTVEVAERAPFEARLEALAFPIESRTAFTSYFRDPEGNRVAISHYPER